jgi:hypothetical protein
MAATKHTCGGPKWGKLTDGCPRCDELRGGAAPVRWTGSGRDRGRLELDRYRVERMLHDCKRSGCGPVCTFGDW